MGCTLLNRIQNEKWPSKNPCLPNRLCTTNKLNKTGVWKDGIIVSVIGSERTFPLPTGKIIFSSFYLPNCRWQTLQDIEMRNRKFSHNFKFKFIQDERIDCLCFANRQGHLNFNPSTQIDVSPIDRKSRTKKDLEDLKDGFNWETAQRSMLWKSFLFCFASSWNRNLVVMRRKN